ncbi:hypothetical protein [Bifidobacterium crudilactis]|uniref:hypothetical protein n=1 Tax=Bifidobacterium crudilactis TaxID=327277 RepID=UPI0026478C64|nr:hypothetical protein [Bifidobacterium crudilactis]MDN5973325.1 hypothetical protein [Bifidobacterium crudilactis]MDN6468144.1 hypothetical protein [Bifidobacterium crudilactis]MDN6655053.1 hypothetical protein [Bifidobacterium crudilactis]MDN6773288.1 hypothetical protein [Bifidobacterium crudilactis]
MTSNTSDTYTLTRLARIAREQHIGKQEINQGHFRYRAEHIDYDHERFMKTTSTQFMPAIEYRSPTRWLYHLPDDSIAVLWTAADYTEFDCYDGNLSVPDGYELWINNEWLVLSNGTRIEDELGNWEPRTPLHTVTDHILAIIGTPTTPIDNSEMVVNLEDYDLAATQPDDMDVENALIDSAYDSLRYEYGRSVADQWAKEKRLAIHQWLRRRNHQHANRQRKAGNR